MPKTDPAIEELLLRLLSRPMRAAQRDALDNRVASSFLGAGEARPARTKRSRRLILLVALLAVAMPFAAAGVDDLSALLDRLVPGPEFQTELDAAMAEVPLPDGRAWPDVPSLDAANFRGPYESDPPPDGDYYQAGGGHSTVEYIAACIWFDEWLVAHDSGDAERQAAAAQTISAIPTWDLWTSPFSDKSYTDLLQRVIDGVESGDAEPLRQFAALNCDFGEE